MGLPLRRVLWCAALAAAQHPNGGIAKYTMAVTDPISALDWVLDVGKWPVNDCRTPGNATFCNGAQACGRVGRTSVCATPGCETGPGPGDQFMFPHMVNASARPIGDASVAAVEAAFDAKFARALAADSYDAFLDFSLIVHAASLDPWANGSVLLAWTDNQHKPWFSAITRVPRTQVQVEIVSERRPTTGGPVREDLLMRYPATGSCVFNKCASRAPGLWTPLAVSKAVSDLDAVVDFYAAVFGAAEAAASAAGGARLKTLYFPDEAFMQVRLVERPPAATHGWPTVAALEALKMAAHDGVALATERAAALCGVDKWFDNHWGLDQRNRTLGTMIRAMEARNWTRYHLWSWNMYLIDPTGDGVQTDAAWGDDAPPWRTEAVADALMNLCSQGNCAAVANATKRCAAELASACGALAHDGTTHHVAACADCAHWHRADLVAAGCTNADSTVFCVGA